MGFKPLSECALSTHLTGGSAVDPSYPCASSVTNIFCRYANSAAICLFIATAVRQVAQHSERQFVLHRILHNGTHDSVALCVQLLDGSDESTGTGPSSAHRRKNHSIGTPRYTPPTSCAKGSKGTGRKLITIREPSPAKLPEDRFESAPPGLAATGASGAADSLGRKRTRRPVAGGREPTAEFESGAA